MGILTWYIPGKYLVGFLNAPQMACPKNKNNGHKMSHSSMQVIYTFIFKEYLRDFNSCK